MNEGKECSGAGQCVNGSCVCNPHFAGTDCSDHADGELIPAVQPNLQESNLTLCVTLCLLAFSIAYIADCKFLADCNMHGACIHDPVDPIATGFCNCSSGFTGSRCEHSESFFCARMANSVL